MGGGGNPLKDIENVITAPGRAIEQGVSQVGRGIERGVGELGKGIEKGVQGIGRIFGGGGGASDAGLQDIRNAQMNAANEVGAPLTAVQPKTMDFANALADKALGKAPSIAEAQLQAAMNQNLQNQLQAARANRSVNPALAQRSIQNQAGQQAAQTAQQGAIMRMKEQEANQNQFGTFLAQQRTAQGGLLGGAAGSEGQMQSINAANQARSDGIFKNILNMGATAGMVMASDKNLKTGVRKYAKGGAVEKLSKEEKERVLKMACGGQVKKMAAGGSVDFSRPGFQAPQTEEEDMGPTNDFLKGLMKKAGPASTGAGGGMAMAMKDGGLVPGEAEVDGDSETNDKVPALLSPGEIVLPRSVVEKGPEAAKKFAAQHMAKMEKQPKKYAEGGAVEAKQPVETKQDAFKPKNFLDAIQATSFEYKKGKNMPEGRFLGVMAQDLEKAGPVGKSMVQQTPAGKQVDFGRGFAAILAAQADLNKRMKKLE